MSGAATSTKGNDLAGRRTFLRGLASLPLVGGSVAILGQPTAAAVPVSNDLLAAYDQRLFYERRFLVREQYAHCGRDMVREMERAVPVNTFADRFHFPMNGAWQDTPSPSTRAAVVLSAAGVPLMRGAA